MHPCRGHQGTLLAVSCILLTWCRAGFSEEHCLKHSWQCSRGRRQGDLAPTYQFPAGQRYLPPRKNYQLSPVRAEPHACTMPGLELNED